MSAAALAEHFPLQGQDSTHRAWAEDGGGYRVQEVRCACGWTTACSIEAIARKRWAEHAAERIAEAAG